MTTKTATKPAAKPTLFTKGKRRSFLKGKQARLTEQQQAQMLREVKAMRKQIAQMEAERGAR